MTERFRRMGDPYGVYPAPREIDPTKVADLMDVSGRELCLERWHWICPRDLSDLATEGRRLMQAGRRWPGPRPTRARGPRPGGQKTNR